MLRNFPSLFDCCLQNLLTIKIVQLFLTILYTPLINIAMSLTYNQGCNLLNQLKGENDGWIADYF